MTIHIHTHTHTEAELGFQPPSNQCLSKHGLVLPAHSIMLETEAETEQSTTACSPRRPGIPPSKGDRQCTCKQTTSNAARFCPLTVHNWRFQETWSLKSCDIIKSDFSFSRNRNKKPCGIESGGTTKFPLCCLSPTFDNVLPAPCPGRN